MAGLNINAGAQGNPLDALLNGRPQYGNLGGLLQAQFSSAPTGEGGYALNPNDGYIWGNDPRWQAAYSALQNYNGNGEYVQLRNDNIGGPGNAIDPSKVTYDPQYGLVTPRSNVKALGNGTFWDNYGGLLLMAPVAAEAIAAGASGELGGAAAGAGDVATSDLGALGTVNGEGATVGTAGTAGGTAGAAGDLGNAAGSNGLLSGGGGYVDDPGFVGANGSNGFLGNLMSGNVGDALSSAGSWAMSHPLQAVGLAQTASGLLHRNNSTPGGGDGKSSGGSGLPGGSLNIPAVNYTPNPYLMAQLQRGYQ